MKIGFVKMYPDTKLPTKAHVNDAAFDCYLHLDKERFGINPHQTVMLSLGFKMEIPNGYCALLMPRSGMGKQNINPGNCVGLIDSNYKGEVKALIHNDSNDIKTLEDGTRVCQMFITPVVNVEAEEITEDQMTDSERGEDGFGSSGVK